VKDTQTITIHKTDGITAKDSSSIDGIRLKHTISIGFIDLPNSTLLVHRGQVAIEPSF
jgi:hypothetical protein